MESNEGISQRESVNKNCAVCDKPHGKACSFCAKVYYCGVEHQKAHRKKHKAVCYPGIWTARDDELKLMSTKKLNRGDLILKETCILHRHENCSDVSSHDNDTDTSNSQCVERLSELEKKDVKTWNMVLEMTRLQESYSGTYSRICQQKGAKSKSSCNHKSLSAIWKLNPFKPHLFPTGSLLSHSCVPNCYAFLKNDTKGDCALTLILRVVSPVLPGEILSICFSPGQISILGTVERRDFLQKLYDINCHCERCSDPSELNTFISGLKCIKCNSGYVLPILNPEKSSYSWRCHLCKNAIDDAGQFVIPKQLESFNDYNKVILYCKCLQGKVHTNHWSLLTASHSLIKLNFSSRCENISEKDVSIFQKLYYSAMHENSVQSTFGESFAWQSLEWLFTFAKQLSHFYNENGDVIQYVLRSKERVKWQTKLQDILKVFPEFECLVNQYFVESGSLITDVDKLQTQDSEYQSVMIAEDEQQGRFLVATRDISCDEIIFKEKALLCSPSSVGTQFRRVCLGCCKTVNTNYKCSKCRWPVCDATCETAAPHVQECLIFASASVPPVLTKNYQYEYIKALRCLLVRDSDSTRWQKMLKLESHQESRHKRPARVQLIRETVSFIRQKCKLTQFEPEIIDFVVGINGVNSFGLQLGPPDGFRTGSFLFLMASMMSHNCEPNSTSKYTLTMKNDKTQLETAECIINVLAKRDIRKGESITTTYVDLSLDTMERQRFLNGGYYFFCTCDLCLAENELQDLILKYGDRNVTNSANII